MKQIISWALRNISRKSLQLFSHFLLKVAAIFYWGSKVECPVCQHTFRKFLPYGRIPRSNALCPNCLALERHRLIWLYLADETNFFGANRKMLHIAPELCFIDRFKKMANLDYITADIESPLATVKMDIHAIPFDENTFDVIFCNHVLEHVEDDGQALNELYRVLKPGGWAVLQVPFFYPIPEQTLEDKSVTDPKEREKLFGQDDHLRKYGQDYPERLRKAGFEVEINELVKNLASEKIIRYGLPDKEKIYICHKILDG